MYLHTEATIPNISRRTYLQDFVSQISLITMGHNVTLSHLIYMYTVAEAGLFLAFYWYQIFTLDSVVVKTQNCLARRRLPNYCNVSSQRNNLKSK